MGLVNSASVQTGAFGKGSSFSTVITNTSATGYTLTFSASKSNSIYTDSGKVYPLSLALNFIIKC